MQKIDLTGQRFGMLVVLRQSGWFFRKDGGRLATWLCRCDCGNEKVIVGADLRHKRHGTKSCGCIVKREKGEAAFDRLYHRFQRQARKRKYSWNLSKDDVRFLTSQPCFYCGIEPKYVSGEYTSNFNGVYLYNGIDRVNNFIGYEINNCVPCCGTCNKIKMNLEFQVFKEHISQIYNHWASK